MIYGKESQLVHFTNQILSMTLFGVTHRNVRLLIVALSIISVFLYIANFITYYYWTESTGNKQRAVGPDRFPVNAKLVPELDIDRMLEKLTKNSSLIAKINAGKPMVIQWRTTQFKHEPFHNRMGKAIFRLCPIKNCMILPMDVDNFSYVDAYLFHAAQKENCSIPAQRHPWQKYILVAMEAEIRTIIPTFIKDIFNLTISYRLDADIPVPQGFIERKLPSDPIPRPGANFAANKTGLVAWVVSNCKTLSKREEYAAELQKHISLDIYGACGTTKWPKPYEKCNTILALNQASCWEYLHRKYKFFFASENSICVDYVTEKVYRTLNYGGMVPVVLGAADYAARFPEKSYIHVADFNSLKELADYLKMLDVNDALYNEYFQWQYHYKSIERGGHVCYLCAYLHLNKSVKKVIPDAQEWFSPTGRCMEPREYFWKYL